MQYNSNHPILFWPTLCGEPEIFFKILGLSIDIKPLLKGMEAVNETQSHYLNNSFYTLHVTGTETFWLGNGWQGRDIYMYTCLSTQTVHDKLSNYQYRTCVIASIRYSTWISQPISKISNNSPTCNWKQPNTFCWTLRWVFQKKYAKRILKSFSAFVLWIFKNLIIWLYVSCSDKATYMGQNLFQNDNEMSNFKFLINSAMLNNDPTLYIFLDLCYKNTQNLPIMHTGT